MFDNKIVELEEGMNTLDKGIAKLKNILEGEAEEDKFSAQEYVALYTTVYYMCTQKPPYDYSRHLYDKFREYIEDYLASTVLPCLRKKDDEFMLRELVKRWQNHKRMVGLLSRFFYHLDRFHVIRCSLPTLSFVGFMCFYDLVYMEVKGKVVEAVTSLIDREREGEQLDGAVITNAVYDIFSEIEMGPIDWYRDFEVSILQRTSRYYSRKASNWIPRYSFSNYFLKVEECLKWERERVAPYLHSGSEPKLEEKVKQGLYTKQLLDREFSKCHNLADQIDFFSRMFTLFSPLPQGLNHVSSVFKEHVITECMALAKRTRDANCNHKVFVQKLIQLHHKYLEYVKYNFHNDSLFHKAVNDAFEVFCNKNVCGSSIAEQLATLCDNILKKGRIKLSDDIMIEQTLEKIAKFIACISDSDLFAEFYRKKLAYRLFFDDSTNHDNERSFLTKLKHQCGALFTSKMEGMITDLMMAKKNRRGFEEYLSNNSKIDPGIDLTVTVLATCFWPCPQTFELNLPPELMRCVEVYEKFYQTKSKHRKLRWSHSFGTCNIKGNFETKTIELTVTTYQACVLLLFNSSDRLSYSEIKTKLLLSDDDDDDDVLIQLLHSLSCGKYKILNKESNTEKISSSDYFEFNSKFTDSMTRIKIPLPLVSENKKMSEKVGEDRRYAIDASIVHIMKNRRVLNQQQLVMECIKRLSHMLKPQVKEIKKRIENLILLDYFERDRNDVNLLRYLA